jgi:alcohol dehydrogenase (cytochrome c)
VPLGMHRSEQQRRRRGLLLGSLAIVAVAGVALLSAGVASGSGAAPGAVNVGEWPLPGADLQNTRNVPGPITSANVGTLQQAWSVPIKAIGAFGSYASTPVVVAGIVYTQDIDSNVYAIDLATGKLLWYHEYNSPDAGPNGVTISGGVVYGATGKQAFALQAATGEELWSKTLTRNKSEGIDMAPGFDNGTVYISTVPGNATHFAGANGSAILWAMDAKTGAVKWKWNETPANLWPSKAKSLNSGGGQWYPPSFDKAGDIYLGVANPQPVPGTKKYPFGSSRPGDNLYTDSIVKLDHKTGKLDWYYQLTPHDIDDWDLQNSPIVTTANGKGEVIGSGKSGIVVAVDQATGKLLWKTPVGKHNGHDHDGLLTLAQAKKKLKFPFTVWPGILGGVESQMAVDSTNVYATVNNIPSTYTSNLETGIKLGDITKGTGVEVALNKATGKTAWFHRFDQSPYGAASVTNDVLFTTTFGGTVWALSTKTGKALWHTQLAAGTNSTVAIAGNTVITAGSFPLTPTQVPSIVAYRLPS